MLKAVDDADLTAALEYARNMLLELKTPVLEPQKYFSLYLDVTSKLLKLGQYFAEVGEGDEMNMSELYDRVQYTGNVLPRLYLLCTVGGVYIKSKQAAAKNIIKDLIEVCLSNVSYAFVPPTYVRALSRRW